MFTMFNQFVHILTTNVQVVLALAFPIESAPPAVGKREACLLVGTVVHLYLTLRSDRKPGLIQQYIWNVAFFVTRVGLVCKTASKLYTVPNKMSMRCYSNMMKTRALSSSVHGRHENATSIPISAGMLLLFRLIQYQQLIARF